MLNLIIIALIIGALIFLLKARHFKHRISILLIMLLMLFFYFTFTFAIKDYSIDLKTTGGITSAVNIYFSWLGHAFDNVKTLTGNAIKMDWFSSNRTTSNSNDFMVG